MFGLSRKKSELAANLIQAAIVIILLPFIAILLGAISGPAAAGTGPTGIVGSITSSLLKNVPLCKIWVDILNQTLGVVTAESLFSSTVLVILKAFPQAMISAICVHVSVKAFGVLRVRGGEILSAFVGITVASVLTALIGLSRNDLIELIIDVVVVIIMIIGVKIMFTGRFGITRLLSVKQILLFVIDAILAVITSAFISSLVMAMAKMYPSTGQAIIRSGFLGITTVIVAFCVHLLNKEAEKDDDLY